MTSLLNRDGSENRIVSRALTDDERAMVEAKAREDAAAQRAREIQASSDRLLLNRYPDQASHDLA
jgi:hypothetical protein